MKKYVVRMTEEALADMEALYHYIAVSLQAPENAMGQYNRIADAILTLDVFPDRHAIFDSEPEHSMKIHRMAVDHYLVCFVIDPEVVTVISVLYGASDVQGKLRTGHREEPFRL